MVHDDDAFVCVSSLRRGWGFRSINKHPTPLFKMDIPVPAGTGNQFLEGNLRYLAFGSSLKPSQQNTVLIMLKMI